MYDLKAIMERLTLMEKEAVNTLTSGKVDAKSFFPYQQEVLPYFTNRLLRFTIEAGEDGLGEDVIIDRYQIEIHYVAAHLTEGYEGEAPDKIYEIIPAMLDYFSKHELLSTSTLDPIDFVDPEGAQLTDGSYNAFTNSGIGPTQIGPKFTLDLPLIRGPYPTDD